MSFEVLGTHEGSARSPGGFEFGVQGFSYGTPIPTSITFFIDGSALVADQYGRRIKGIGMPDGRNFLFADSPPEAVKDGDVQPRPQFATHAQVVEAMVAERIEWTSYTVKYVQNNTNKRQDHMTKDKAREFANKVAKDGATRITVDRTISCAGWPQLPYAELVKLPELPPTPLEELRKIRDPQLRKDALRARREVVDAAAKELTASEAE